MIDSPEMTKRQHYAAHSPMSLQDAVSQSSDIDRLRYQRVLKVMAKMHFAYADAMMAVDAADQEDSNAQP